MYDHRMTDHSQGVVGGASAQPDRETAPRIRLTPQERVPLILDAAMHERFARLAQYAVDCGSHAILFTCSAFGPCIEAVARQHAPLPVLKPNEAMVADELASGRLQRVLPLWQGEPVPVYVITETRLLPAKTQRFIEFLRERLGQG